jgi:peptidoglycan/xylan/chitin deacetylase (PgdA/CDA1 family)
VANNFSTGFAFLWSEEVIPMQAEEIKLGPPRSTKTGSSATKKVSLVGFDVPETQIIRNLLYPFKIEFVPDSTQQSDLTLCKGLSEPKIECKKLILVSTRDSDDKKVFEGNNEILVFPYRILSDCLERLEGVMAPKISMAFKLSTRLPFVDYSIVPSSIRSQMLRTQHRHPTTDLDILNHLSFEVARRKLVESFAQLGTPLQRKNPPSIVLTHDIETEKGLERAVSLKKIEDDFGISSTWFVVSDQYPIPRKIAGYLADHSSEIGSHDTKHDGRLLSINKQEDLVSRLRASREKLAGIFEREVTSFRAPLLQFSYRIVSALGKAGYRDDFSLPCWEPVHPSTMHGFGIESASKFEMNNQVVEHPLTLFQDHQVLNVLGLSPSKAVKFWMEQMSLIRAFDGDAVFLIHPDYSFGQDLDTYKQLIESISFLKMQEHVDALLRGPP